MSDLGRFAKKVVSIFFVQYSTISQEMFYLSGSQIRKGSSIIWKGWTVNIQYSFILLPSKMTGGMLKESRNRNMTA